jgi:hypothetical protein
MALYVGGAIGAIIAADVGPCEALGVPPFPVPPQFINATVIGIQINAILSMSFPRFIVVPPL